MEKTTDLPLVEVIYHIFPHYRIGVMRELQNSRRYAFRFRASSLRSYFGIPGITDWTGFYFVNAPIWHLGRFVVQFGAIRAAISSPAEAFIFLSNPYFLCTWIAAGIARMRGKRVIFWGHGWIVTEGHLRMHIKRIFFRLPHQSLFYGDRARKIAISQGFDPARLFVVGNSLESKSSELLLTPAHTEGVRQAIRHELKIPDDTSVLICVARLIQNCRFELLFHAMRRLKYRGENVTALLVGDGPERERLEFLASEGDLDVRFLGAEYDECRLSKLYFASDVTVSPGKIGLTCMHSLSYGVPVISHDDWEKQMPEAEAICPGINGDYFQFGDAVSLELVIGTWIEKLRRAEDRHTVRLACLASLVPKFTPEFQREVIESALTAAVG